MVLTRYHDRAKEEDVDVEADALDTLTEIAQKTSLRYSIHLITTAAVVCGRRKGNKISLADVRRVYSLFVDVKRSVQYLKEYQQEYLFNEVNDAMDDS